MFTDSEFGNRFKGRHFGKYRALVTNNDDPRKLGRVRVLCEPVYGRDESPWAFPCTPLGGSVDGGFFMVPPVNALVWVEFEEGHTNSPIYTGGFWDDTNVGRPSDGSPIERSSEYQHDQNPVPKHAQGKYDGNDFDGSMKGQPGVPPSSFAGRYPHVRIIRSPSGHQIEMDDTEGAERLVITHKTGSAIEFQPDGSMHEITSGNKHSFSQGRTRVVEGNESLRTVGSRTDTINGNYDLTIGGAYNVKYTRGHTVDAPSMTRNIGGDDSTVTLGALSYQAMNSIDFVSAADIVLGAMGNFHTSAGGAGTMVWANGYDVVQTSEAVKIAGLNGRATLSSEDKTGLISRVGITAQSLGVDFSPVPKVGTVGPVVKIGNLSLPIPPDTVPLIHEPVVMGEQLNLYLKGLHAFLTQWLTDYISHAHPWYSPAYTAAVSGPALSGALTTLSSTWLTPAGPKLHPLILSDLVFVSKT